MKAVVSGFWFGTDTSSVKCGLRRTYDRLVSGFKGGSCKAGSRGSVFTATLSVGLILLGEEGSLPIFRSLGVRRPAPCSPLVYVPPGRHCCHGNRLN